MKQRPFAFYLFVLTFVFGFIPRAWADVLVIGGPEIDPATGHIYYLLNDTS